MWAGGGGGGRGGGRKPTSYQTMEKSIDFCEKGPFKLVSCIIFHFVVLTEINNVYMNFYQKPGSSNLIGWKLEVGVDLNLFSMTRVKIGSEYVTRHLNWKTWCITVL